VTLVTQNTADRTLDDVAGLLASLDEARVVRPSADPHAAAATALLVADYLGQPDVMDKLDDVGMGPESVADLRRLARAILSVIGRLGGEYLPDAIAIPGDLVDRGQHVRTTIAASLQKALPDDRDVGMWLEAVRLGAGVVDLVYDLRTLAELCTVYGKAGGTAAGAAQTALSAADAVEFALRAGDSPDLAAARNTIAQLWTLFVPAYERAAAAGRALTRSEGAERQFPPLALVASHRRARRRPVSLVPPRRRSMAPPAVAIPKPPKPPKPASVTPPALEEVELIDATPDDDDAPELQDLDVVISEAPPPLAARPASEPPLAGERISWSDTRKKNRHMVEIEVGIASQSNLYLGFTENLSSGGVFVATYASKPIGSAIEIALAFPNGDELKVPGVVRWLREATTDGWPGMGVQFESLSPEDEAKLRKFLAVRDPLFYDD
jgi:uncharacterized protein (TIGR02266 family)